MFNPFYRLLRHLVLFLFLILFAVKVYCEECPEGKGRNESSLHSTKFDPVYEIEAGHYKIASEFLKKHLSSHPDDYDAVLLLLKVSEITGDRRTILRYRHLFRNLYSSGKLKTAPAFTAYAKTVRDSDPKGALFLLDKAHKADKNYIEAYIQAGDLCYERYAWGRAEKELKNALTLDPENRDAVAGLAVLDLAYGRISSASERLKKALKKYPDSVILLTPTAYIALIEDDFKKCSEILHHVEKINPSSMELFSIYAALYELDGKYGKRDDYIKRAVSVNPASVEVYNLLSVVSEQKYRFKKAVEWAEKAIDADPGHWRGYFLAGNNLLHLGEEKKGYKLLSESFAKNSFNVIAYNILNVLDRDFKYHEFNSYDTEHFTVKISKSDAPFIWPYLKPLLEKTYKKFTKQFEIEPVGPKEHNGRILIHILPDHNSFSVRTMGLPGISANGVCFGQVVLMPSPRYVSLGNTRGMNWKSVFEHEFLHILTLQKSDYKISRWLTEGISSLEESDLHGEWNRYFAMADKSDKLLPIDKLESGFLNPSYPMQVPVSYYQAAITCRYFKETFGNKSIIRMIELYKQGKSTEEVVSAVSGMSLENLNKNLEKFYNKERERGENLVNTFAAEIKELEARLKLNKKDDDKQSDKTKAQRSGKRKWEKIVEYWREKKESGKAVKLLNNLLAFDDSDFKIFKVLGEIYHEQKKWKPAADTLLRAVYRNPFDKKVHEMAAECYKHLKMKEEEERERKILLQL